MSEMSSTSSSSASYDTNTTRMRDDGSGSGSGENGGRDDGSGSGSGENGGPPTPPMSVLVFPRPVAEDAFRSGSPVELTREMLKSKFHMRLSDAAQSLSISITRFKQVCRKLGVARWPRSLHRPRPPRTGAKARAESDHEDDIEEEAPSESRKRRAEPATMRQAGPWAHAQALPSMWSKANGVSKHDMLEVRVPGGESYKRSRHMARDAMPNGLARGAGEFTYHNEPSAPGAPRSLPDFAPLSPNNMLWGGLPMSSSNQRSVGQTVNVGVCSDRRGGLFQTDPQCSLGMAALSDFHRPTAMSSLLPSAPGFWSQQQQMMLTPLPQSAASAPSPAAAVPPGVLQHSKGMQSIQALNEQILATKLQIAKLEASRQQQAACNAASMFMCSVSNPLPFPNSNASSNSFSVSSNMWLPS